MVLVMGYNNLIMERPQNTINRQIIREGASLAGHKWLRMPLAVLLGLGGLMLLYNGVSDGDKVLVVIGAIFVGCAVLSCVIVRRAERTICKLQNKIDDSIKRVEEKGNKDSTGS